MQVQDVMTKGLDFVIRTDTVQEVAKKMDRDNVGALPVFDSNFAVGIVTDRDIAVRCTAQNRDPAKTYINQIMSDDLFFCDESVRLDEAAEIMAMHHVRRLLVKNSMGHVVGMVSIDDLAKSDDPKLAAYVLRHASTPANPQR